LQRRGWCPPGSAAPLDAGELEALRPASRFHGAAGLTRLADHRQRGEETEADMANSAGPTVIVSRVIIMSSLLMRLVLNNLKKYLE